MLPAPPMPPAPPCLWCLDPGAIIDPGVILHVDLTPPTVSNVSFVYCVTGYDLSFDVDEHSEMWVSYTTLFGSAETEHRSGMSASFNVPALHATDIVIHAVDDAGNETILSPVPGFCF